jgi:hypothetical protein
MKKEMGALTSKPFAFKTRPWELNRIEDFDIVDSFGLKVQFDIRAGEILRVLPSLFSRIGSKIFKNFTWITDRTRFSYDALLRNRNTFPVVKFKKDERIMVNWLKILNYIFYIFVCCNFSNLSKTNFILLGEKSGESNFFPIQFLSGELTNGKELILLKKLSQLFSCSSCSMSENLDINLITFKPDASYFFLDLNFLEKCNNLFLINFDTRLELPIFNLVLRKLINSNENLNIYNIGNNLNLNFPVIHLGTNLSFVQLLLEGKNYLSFSLLDFFKASFLFGESCLLRSDFIELFNYISGNYFANYILNIRYFIILNSLGALTSVDFGFFSKKNQVKNNVGINYSLTYRLKSNFNFNIIQNSYIDILFNDSADVLIPVCNFSETENIFRSIFGDLIVSKVFTKRVSNTRTGWQVLFFLLRKKFFYEKKEEYRKFLNLKSSLSEYFKCNNSLFKLRSDEKLNYWIRDFEENGVFWRYDTSLVNYYQKFKDLSIFLRSSEVMSSVARTFEWKAKKNF